MTILVAVVTVGGLTFLLTTLLLIASRRLYVYEDPRLDSVEELLPKSNCGACGYPGCRAFAEALVEGAIEPAQCTVSTPAGISDIAELLGVDAGTQDRNVARLACAGGSNVARQRARYIGMESCLAASQVGGGGKDCAWGCLGYGDCAAICDFEAITMNDYGLPNVISDNCTACGDCVEVCPKDLFSLQPLKQQLWVRCKNQEKGDDILEACEVACTACARCALDAPNKSVEMQDNLPLIHYEQLQSNDMNMNGRLAIERCPTGAIVWIEGDNDKLGAAANPVVRQTSRPQASV